MATAQHAGEGLHFVFATAALAGLFVVTLGANTFDDILAFELLLHAAQGTVDGLVFTDFDLDGHVGTEGWAEKKRVH